MAIKVAIADDHPVFLAGIRNILEGTDEILLVGEANDGQEAIDLVEKTSPDIIVMDITMPIIDGIQATKKIQISFPDTKVLALSIHSGKRFIKEMLDAGASGYLLKDSAPDELVTAIQKIAKGEMFLSSSITSTALSKDEESDEYEPNNILHTKLYRPPVLNDIIIRTELLDLLEKNLNNPLSLVTAPAGYGKSMLASHWLENSKAISTWMSLDEELNDLRIFLIYIHAAIEKIFPGALDKTGILLQAATLPSIREIAYSFLNEVDHIEKDFILVLDDYHYINEEKIHQFIDEILRFPPEHMHLCIVTRRDPALNLGRIRSHSRMIELRMEELSFSNNEIADLFLNLHNITLPAKSLNILREKTEGWIVGLRLACAATKNIEDIDRIISQLKGSFHSISKFLLQEVLFQQPHEIQELMKITSIFDRFCMHLVDDICLKQIDGGAGDITGDNFIQWLINSNLFVIPLDEENHWFRYHHLLQDLLKNQLEQDQNADKISGIHLSASKWCESKDFIGESIRHALMAGDHARAVELVKKYRHIEINQDRWFTVQHWLDMFPEELVQQSIDLQLARLLPLFEQFRLLEISQILEHIESLMPEKNPEPAVEGEISFFQGYLMFFLHGDIKNSLKLLTKAKKRLPEIQLFVRGEIELYQAIILHFEGDGELAFKSLSENLKTTDSSDFVIYSRLMTGLIWIHMLSGDITLALDIAERLRILAIQKHNTYIEAFAHYTKANIHLQSFDKGKAILDFNVAIQHRHILHIKFVIDAMAGQCLSLQLIGQTQEALNKLKQFLEFAQNTGDAQHIAVAESFRARLSLLQGNVSTAIQWARSFNLEIPALGMLYFLEIPSITQARVLIMAGTDADLNRSQELLGTQLQQVRNLHNTYQVIEILVLQSIAFEKLEKLSDALDTMKEAVMLAGSQAWVRPFVEAGEPVTRLLKKLLEKNIAVNQVEILLNKFEKGTRESADMTPEISGMKQGPPHKPVPNVEETKLTLREMEIINLLSEGLRNKEIASRIHVSEDTVKKHLYNTYQKLDVNNRMELVNKSKLSASCLINSQMIPSFNLI